jgi:hypothetical protein
MALSGITGVIAVIGMDRRLGVRWRPDVMDALRGMTVDTLCRIGPPELKDTVVNGFLVGIHRFRLGFIESHHIVEVFVGMTAGTEFHDFKGRTTGLVFKPVGDVDEGFLKTLFLVAVEASRQYLIRGNLFRQGIEVIEMTVLAVRF